MRKIDECVKGFEPYLKDRPELRRDKGKVFDDIKSGIITNEQLESSDHFEKIEGRINLLPELERLLDDNDTIFKYNGKANSFSLIKADYLMKNNLDGKNVFVFLSKGNDDKYFCRSFFPQKGYDYSKGQAKWTLLYKKKVLLSLDKEIVLYNRLEK